MMAGLCHCVFSMRKDATRKDEKKKKKTKKKKTKTRYAKRRKDKMAHTSHHTMVAGLCHFDFNQPPQVRQGEFSTYYVSFNILLSMSSLLYVCIVLNFFFSIEVHETISGKAQPSLILKSMCLSEIARLLHRNPRMVPSD